MKSHWKAWIWEFLSVYLKYGVVRLSPPVQEFMVFVLTPSFELVFVMGFGKEFADLKTGFLCLLRDHLFVGW